MRRPWPRRDWTDRPTEPGRPAGMEARLAVMEASGGASQGRLLDDANVPLAVPDRPEVKAARDALDTAARAAQLALPRSGTQRMRVLRVIYAWTISGREGITDAELEDEMGLSGNSVRPRRLELVEQGWVEDGGRRRPHGRSGPGVVWRVTEAGRRAYERLP